MWVKNLSILICQFFFFLLGLCQTFSSFFKAKVIQKWILIRVVKEKRCHEELLNKMKFRRIQKHERIFLCKRRETSTINRYMYVCLMMMTRLNTRPIELFFSSVYSFIDFQSIFILRCALTHSLTHIFCLYIEPTQS